MSASLEMTAAEFIATPVPTHGRPWNLIDGEVIVNDPTWLHATALANVLQALRDWTDAAPGRGAANPGVDIGIDQRNVFVPDVLWYSEGRVPNREAVPPYPVPDLAVEVRSPSTWRYDIGSKREGYERAGLPELWLVDTFEQVVIVHARLASGEPAFGVTREFGVGSSLFSPLLPGFDLPVQRVFAN